MTGCETKEPIHPCRPDETNDDRVGALCVDGFTSTHKVLACLKHKGLVHYLCD